MRLNQNMESLSVYRNYSKSLKIQNAASEKISTGMKINSAKDNPNKIALRQGLRLQVRSIQMSERNLQDGMSMMQSVDGVLSSIDESMLRLKELTVKAGSVTADSDLEIIQTEINQIKKGIDQMINTADFNGVNILNVADESKTLPHMIGINSGENIEIPLFNITTNNLKDDKGNSLFNLDIRDRDINKALSVVENSMKKVISVRSRFGSVQNRMETAMENIQEISLSIQNAESRVSDADIALEMAEFSRGSILTDTSLALMQQTNNFPKDILGILQGMR